MTEDTTELVGQTTLDVDEESSHHLDSDKLLAYLRTQDAFKVESDSINIRKFSVGQVRDSTDSRLN